MKIASRASNEVRRDFTTIENEGALSDHCDDLRQKIRRLAPEHQYGQDDSVVIFCCTGAPSRTHRRGVHYNYYVQLEPHELLAGLVSLPPDDVEAAVEKIVRSLAIARQEQWLSELSDGVSPRDCGWPTASEVIETANAIARGLVTSLSHETFESRACEATESGKAT